MRFVMSIAHVRAVLLCTAAAVSCAVWANTQTVGAYEWTYHVLGSISETEPATTNWTDAVVESVSPAPEGALVIPDRLGVWPVTHIKGAAFKACTGLTEVTLPASVTNVGASAFQDCTSLTRVRILASGVKFGLKPFAGCTAVTFVEMPVRSAFSTLFPDSRASLREAVVVEGALDMVGSAFANCPNLVSVTIPSTVTNIRASAFASCTSLTSLTIPASVRRIGSKAFKGCSALASLTFLGDKPDPFPSLSEMPKKLVVYVEPGAQGWPKYWLDGRRVKVRSEQAGVAGPLPEIPVVAEENIVGGMQIAKARMFYGCQLDAVGKVVGVFSVKAGRTARGRSSFTVALTDLQSRNTTVARNRQGAIAAGPVTIPLSDGHLVFGTTASGEIAFSGRQGDVALTSGVVLGGAVAGTATFSLPAGCPSELPKIGVVETAYLPLEMAVERTGTDGRTWKCPKLGKVGRKKDVWTWSYKLGLVTRTGTPETLSECVDLELLNLSVLRLSYRPASGRFKGSYKVFGRTAEGRLKSASIPVRGFVVDGIGYGLSVFGKTDSWDVLVR